MKPFVIKMIFLLFIALLGSQSAAYAESKNSVKDCIENPENCNEPNLEPSKKEELGKKTESTVGVTFFDFIKMIFATIFVIALLYAVLRFVNKKTKSFQSTQLVENLGGTSLGSNRSVQVIKVGNQILVVGVGESIQLLKEINDQEEYQKIIESYNNKMEQLIQPSDIVTKLLNKAKLKNVSAPHEENQFATILRKQLSDFSNGRKKLLEDMEKKGSDEQ